MGLLRRADPLRLLASRMGLAELVQVTRQPTVNEALRVSIHYHDGRAPDSVATLRRGLGSACELDVIFDRSPKRAFLHYDISPQRYQDLLVAMRRVNFDKLDDEEDLPFLGVDLWLIERAAGSFYHDVVVCPDTARGHHRELILAFRQYLPEAVRQGA